MNRDAQRAVVPHLFHDRGVNPLPGELVATGETGIAAGKGFMAAPKRIFSPLASYQFFYPFIRTNDIREPYSELIVDDNDLTVCHQFVIDENVDRFACQFFKFNH